ncbi:TrmO family methyltransferase [Streptomyces avermitilis]|uniref:TrmO family methyltransferase domain-containing protein n=1 Tax=Streptomyces avermitilis TaxID=33903 RepID=UPI0033EC76C8
MGPGGGSVTSGCGANAVSASRSTRRAWRTYSFIFDQFPEHDDFHEPRPYRGRSDLPPVGVFAGRGPRRPNRIGVTCCAIESVHGRELTVVGLDAVSGTPVIDLKPTMAEFRAVNIKQPEWVSGLMPEYFQP